VLAETGEAFTHAMGLGLLVAGGLAAAAALVVARYFPSARPVTEVARATPRVEVKRAA
jgi:hypothetical protein